MQRSAPPSVAYQNRKCAKGFRRSSCQNLWKNPPRKRKRYTSVDSGHDSSSPKVEKVVFVEKHTSKMSVEKYLRIFGLIAKRATRMKQKKKYWQFSMGKPHSIPPNRLGSLSGFSKLHPPQIPSFSTLLPVPALPPTPCST